MDYNLSSVSKRVVAYLIDIIPITLIVLLVFIAFGFGEICINYFGDSSNIDARIEFLRWRNNVRDLSFILYIIYSIIMESSKFQATYGKKAMKIKVMNKDGSEINLRSSIKRNIFKVVSSFTFALGFIWILFSKEKQGWHDMFARTLVVEKQ